MQINVMTFFAVTVIATIGALEWLKALVGTIQGGKKDAWVWPVISFGIAMAVGVASIFAGMLPLQSGPNVLAQVFAGIIVGLVVLAFVELAYQILIKSIMALAARVCTWLDGKGGYGGMMPSAIPGPIVSPQPAPAAVVAPVVVAAAAATTATQAAATTETAATTKTEATATTASTTAESASV